MYWDKQMRITTTALNKLNRANRRKRDQDRERHGHKESGRSVKLLAECAARRARGEVLGGDKKVKKAKNRKKHR